MSTNDSNTVNVDRIIEQLLEGKTKKYNKIVRGGKPGKEVNLAENEINYLCNQAREILINQPILLELEAPLKICGTKILVYLFRGYSWPIFRSIAPVRIWWISARFQLSISR